MLTFIRRLHELIYTRLLSTDWHRLKLVDHEQMQRRVDEACNSVQFLIEHIIEETSGIWNLIMAMLTIAILCPWQLTISLILVYIGFFFGYVRQRGREFLKLRIESNKTIGELYEKHSRVASQTLDYILHRERAALVANIVSFQVAIERIWYVVDYAADRLSFVEELLGKTCTFVTIGVLVSTTDNPLIIIPLYHYLSSLVDQLDNTNQVFIRCIRLIKEYDLILPMLNEYEPRIEAPQYEMKNSFTIQSLHFAYTDQTKKGTRFTLKLSQPLSFQNGETILVTGNSGAGMENKFSFFIAFKSIISEKTKSDEYPLAFFE